jgi:hypothetical protein
VIRRLALVVLFCALGWACQAREKATLAWVIYDRSNAEVHRIIYPDFTYQDFASTIEPSESVIFVEMKTLGFPPDVYKAQLAVRKSLLW